MTPVTVWSNITAQVASTLNLSRKASRSFIRSVPTAFLIFYILYHVHSNAHGMMAIRPFHAGNMDILYPTEADARKPKGKF